MLVVDEDPAERAAAVTELSRFADVDVASDVAEAIALSKIEAPDLVVVDAALFEALRAALSGKPIVVLTPRHEVGFELRALERGAIDAISKPVAQSPLRARVRTHLRVRALSSELQAAASTDPLTGLANRRTFFKLLNDEHVRCVRDQLAMHLLLVELDGLGALNARYGRATGDACLERVALAVRQNVRDTDIVARVNGARIAVLLGETTTLGSSIVARRLGEAVSALGIRHEDSKAGVLTVSVVIGYLPPSLGSARPAARLVDGTEHALEMAKDGERGQIWFYDVAS